MTKNRVPTVNYRAGVRIAKAEKRVANAALVWGTGIRFLNDPKYPVTAYPVDQWPLLRALKELRAAKNWHRRAVEKMRRTSHNTGVKRG